jgi:hypothetical protein
LRRKILLVKAGMLWWILGSVLLALEVVFEGLC